MGACASFPKGMKGKDVKAPAPAPEPELEPTMEESVKGATEETVKEVKTEEEKKNDDETKHSLGCLLNEGDEKKEASEGNKTGEEVQINPKEDDQNSREMPIIPKKIEEDLEKEKKEENDGNENKETEKENEENKEEKENPTFVAKVC